MYETIKKAAISFHNSFRSSATILVARLNVAVGCLWTIVLATDPQQLANIVPWLHDPKVLTSWIMINGFLTEYARRRPGTSDAYTKVDPLRPTDSTEKE
jgi:hypothetical protein